MRDFGAVGDGKTDDTRAFEAAIAAITHGKCASVGASPRPTRVLVPGGPSSRVYLIRPINLTSCMELFISANATVLGVANHTRWPLIAPAPSYGQGRDHKGPRYTSLLHGEGLAHITIRGEGVSSVLDGNGAYWWKRHQARTEMFTRGHLLELMYSTDIVIANLTMRDSPFWFTHIFDCDGVHVHGVHIVAPTQPHVAPNTDGWDPDSSRNVLIEHSTYRGGDDCVAIKSGWDCFGVAYARPSVNITIRNVTCDGDVAGVAVGSEVSGGVHDVLVERVHFIRANGPAHIKTGSTRGGSVTNVRFVNLTVADGAWLTEGVLVDATYGAINPSCPAGWRPPAPTRMANFSFEHIYAHSARVINSPFHFWANVAAGIRIEDVQVHDVHLPNAQGHHHNWTCTAGVSGQVVNGTAEPWPPCSELTIVH